MFVSSLSAVPGPPSGVDTHPVLTNLISSHSSSHFPNPSGSLVTPTTFSWSIQTSLAICQGLQFFTTLPCSASFPDMGLPCGHLLTHKLYPIHFFLDFPFLLFHSDFSRSLYALRAAASPFLCNQFRQALIFPYASSPLFFQPQPLLPPHFLYLDPHHQLLKQCCSRN